MKRCYIIIVFYSQVFKQTSEENSKESKEIARSILTYFPEFHAFKLRPPSSDPEVVSNLNQNESSSDVSKLFIWGIDSFKRVLSSKLAPKRGFNDAEFVTGEGKCKAIKMSARDGVYRALFLLVPQKNE